MNYQKIVSAIMAALLTTSGLAFAQDAAPTPSGAPPNYAGEGDQGRTSARQQNQARPPVRQEPSRQAPARQESYRQAPARQESYRQAPERQYQSRSDYRGWQDERGAGPYHEFHRGQRLPPEYRSRQYVVDDWQSHHLSRPPRGYHWVQTGGDYVLVAITTGIILQLLLDH